jgi:hypothetical protein
MCQPKSTGIREMWSNLQRLTADKFPPFLPGMPGNLWHVPNGRCFIWETSVERQTSLTVLEIDVIAIRGQLHTCKTKIIKKRTQLHKNTWNQEERGVAQSRQPAFHFSLYAFFAIFYVYFVYECPPFIFSMLLIVYQLKIELIQSSATNLKYVTILCPCANKIALMHPMIQILLRYLLNVHKFSVILAPFGMSGILTGQTYKASDGYTRKIIEEWRQFYPINSKYLNREPGDGPPLPPAVEVIVGGVKMRYPTCFVLATDMDDPALIMAAQALSLDGIQLSAVGGAIIRGTAPGNLTKSVLQSPKCLKSDTPCCSAGVVPSSQRDAPPKPSTQVDGAPLPGPGPALQLLADPAIALTNPSRQKLDLNERVWQDDSLVHSRLAPSLNQQQAETPATNTSSSEHNIAGHWDFENPSKRVACGCSK